MIMGTQRIIHDLTTTKVVLSTILDGTTLLPSLQITWCSRQWATKKKLDRRTDFIQHTSVFARKCLSFHNPLDILCIKGSKQGLLCSDRCCESLIRHKGCYLLAMHALQILHTSMPMLTLQISQLKGTQYISMPHTKKHHLLLFFVIKT